MSKTSKNGNLKDAQMKLLRKIFGINHVDENEAKQFYDIPSYLKSQLVSNGCDKVENGNGEFGKSQDNPIPVNGPNGEVKYLSMVTPAITFHRLGSIESKVLKRAVDIYEIVTRDGSRWDILYFDMYHARRSRIAPKGFSLCNYHKIFGTVLFAIGTNNFDKTFPHGIPEIMKKRLGGSLGEKIYKKVIPMDIMNRDFRRPKDHFDRIQNILKEIQGQTESNSSKADDIYIRSFYVYGQSIVWGQTLLDAVLTNLCNYGVATFSDAQGDLIKKEVFNLTVFQLTRAIWNFVSDETEATRSNSLVFSWFKEKCGITSDEIEPYAKAAGTSDEVKIFGRNILNILGRSDAVEMLKLNSLAISKLESLLQVARGAFSLPKDNILKLLS